LLPNNKDLQISGGQIMQISNKYLKVLVILSVLTGWQAGEKSVTFPAIAETAASPEPLIFPYKTLALPGSLNTIPVFNSNSPEVVITEGVLLSTFPPEGKQFPEAHLNRALNGKFDIFTHHIAVEREKGDLTNLYEGIILKNPTNKEIKLKILASATYNSQPDAPFIKLPDFTENNDAVTFAGPGNRVSQDILRNKSKFENRLIRIKPGETFLLMNESIAISTLTPPVNGRTSLFKLESDGPLYVADLALYEKKFLWCTTKPSLSDWIDILNKGALSQKRDKIPTPLDQPKPPGQPFIYGRVSGIATGNKWEARIVNDPGKFNIPKKGSGIAYALNTVYANTLSTGQVQSAVMEKRYGDTAYQAHSNYGITYEIEIPLYNNTQENREVTLSFASPIRIPENKAVSELSFQAAPPEKINFRGEFKIEYKDKQGNSIEKFIHIVQRFGQKGQPLLSLNLAPGETNKVKISYIYPADSTPPHVLIVSSD
jgi:hypothetical protein